MTQPTIAEQLTTATRDALVGKKSVDDALRQTIQARVQDSAMNFPAVWWFTQPSEWDIALWWSQQRDLDLRTFVKREGNDILVGAVSSLVKKFKAMNWTVEGPAATVGWAQDLLSEAEFGQGWGTLLSKGLEDYFTTDKGWFIEVIGPGDPDKALDGLPTGLAHLDSLKCQLTGDPSYPVVYYGAKDGRAHKLHASRVIHLVDMESPNLEMLGVGFCACSRVIASSQLLLMLSQYKREKLDDLPQAGILILNNVVPKKWEDAQAEYERERRKLGQDIWANIMTLIGVDPSQPADAKFVSFANLPDHFNEQETITNYINIVALSFGVDVREFWPIGTSSALGSATESMVMHQKARGKAIGELISAIERAINWKVLPKRVTFAFDNPDSEEDMQVAQLQEQKTVTILRMFAPDPTTGETVATREEVRQMLADHVEYFSPDFLLVDVTDETAASDTEQLDEEEKQWHPFVVLDRHGKVVRKEQMGYRAGRYAPVIDKALSNYRAGKVDAESLAAFALAELADHG